MRFSTLIAAFTATLLLMAAVPATHAQTSDQEKKEYYSLYFENYKNENYKEALPYLKWMLKNAPTYPKGDDRNYDRAYRSYVHLAEQAGDAETKNAYADSAMAIIEQATTEVKQAGGKVDMYNWTIRRGRLYQQYGDAFSDSKTQMLDAYLKAYEMKPKVTESYYLDQIVRNYYSEEQKDKALSFLNELEKKRGGEKKVQELLDKWRPQFFDTPAERIAFMEKKLEKDPKNAELMTQLMTLYQQEGYSDKASQLQTRLMEVDPTPEIYREVAATRLDEGKSSEAFALYQKLLQMPDASATARDYYNMGVAQQQMSNFAKARTYFRKALNADSSFGPAYLAIGDLYANAVSQCTGSGKMEPTDQAVYWLAMDYYRKGKSADASVSSAANQKIGSYRQYTPDTETIFFKGWEPGQSYSVDYGCYAWIGESTTVRKK